MSLTWTVDLHADCAEVRLAGRLTLGPQLNRLSRELATLLAAKQQPALVLDLAHATEIDSAGLGELVILYTTAGQQDCFLCLVAPGPRVTKLLEIARLAQLFPRYANLADFRNQRWPKTTR
jgi:anti-anti-sigma factor